MATANQDRLRTHFASLAATPSAQSTGWDTLWATPNFLPWDRGTANPALIDLLANPENPPRSVAANPTPGAGASDADADADADAGGRAVELPPAVHASGRRARVLVPGCGRGYDVALFAAYGYEAVGLEVSGHAVAAADAYLADPKGGAGTGGEGEYEGREGGRGRGGARCVVGDFFADDWVGDAGLGRGEGFDVIYDNTFLCALPPALRPAWAKRISDLLAPTGVLICLEFPTHKPASSGGPPWSLPPTVHSELLKRPGEEVVYDEGGVVVATEREEGEGALRRVAHYTPRRTHEVGVVKGVVRDCVSVWRKV